MKDPFKTDMLRGSSHGLQTAMAIEKLENLVMSHQHSREAQPTGEGKGSHSYKSRGKNYPCLLFIKMGLNG